jgi:hypothetical protein
MRRSSRRVFTPSMGVAFLALGIALGGTSYAVTRIEPRSVGSPQLKRDAVAARHIKPRSVARSHVRPNAVTSAKVADGSLTGADIDEATLGPVPVANTAATASRAVAADVAGRATIADRVVFSERATSAESADHANVTAALERVVYHTQSGSVAAATEGTEPGSTEPSTGSATARCGTGELVVGGGARVDEGARVVGSYPDGGGRWTADVLNEDTAGGKGFTVYAICVAARNTG